TLAVVSNIFLRVMLTSFGGVAPFRFFDLEFRQNPRGLQQWKRDQGGYGRCGNQQRGADCPAEQNGERDQSDQGGEPITDGDRSQQDAASQDRSVRCRVGSLDKSLHVA